MWEIVYIVSKKDPRNAVPNDIKIVYKWQSQEEQFWENMHKI